MRPARAWTGARAGRRVYGAQSYGPFGTAAQATVVPQALAVDLPDAVSDQRGVPRHPGQH